jgi:hypothetical protein
MSHSISACVLAVFGILFLGIVFIPMAFITSLIGTVLAVKTRDIASIGVNISAWILVVIGFLSSPLLVAAIGFAEPEEHLSSEATKDDAIEALLSMDAQFLLYSSCDYYGYEGRFDTVEHMMMTYNIDNEADLSNGGVVKLKAGEGDCVTYTYAAGGTITVEAAKDAEGQACSQFLKSNSFKKIKGVHNCRK